MSIKKEVLPLQFLYCVNCLIVLMDRFIEELQLLP